MRLGLQNCISTCQWSRRTEGPVRKERYRKPLFNIRDLIVLARRYPHHGSIVLAAQAGWSLPDLIAALDRPGALAERLASSERLAPSLDDLPAQARRLPSAAVLVSSMQHKR